MKTAILGAGRIGRALARDMMLQTDQDIQYIKARLSDNEDSNLRRRQNRQSFGSMLQTDQDTQGIDGNQLKLILDEADPSTTAKGILFDSWRGSKLNHWHFTPSSGLNNGYFANAQGAQIEIRQADAFSCLEDLRAFDIQCVIDCTGRLLSYDELHQSLIGNDKRRVILSQPDQSNTDLMHICGMQHPDYTTDESLLSAVHSAKIFSAASCTSVALAPVVQELDRRFGIDSLRSLTLHSSMNDQQMLDGNKSLGGVSGVMNLVPTATKLDIGIEKILPQLAGKVSAAAIRVPLVPTCAMDVMVELSREVAVAELAEFYASLEKFGANQSRSIDSHSTKKHTLIEVCDDALVSMRVLGNESYCVISKQDTMSEGAKLRLLLWFDSEVGFVTNLRLLCQLIEDSQAAG